MKPQALCGALALALSVAAPAMGEPVRLAQATPVAPGTLSPQGAASIVRSMGLHPIAPAVRRDDTYLLRARGVNGREVRIVVDARTGDVMSIVPVARLAPPGGERPAPADPTAPPGYLPPPGPAAAPSGVPSIIYEGDRPVVFERRPPKAIPNTAANPNAPLPAEQQAAPPAVVELTPGPNPRIMAPERGEHGLLPPPPERFPQRATPPTPAKPAAKPAPVKRAAAPADPPLPKPRPITEFDKAAAPASPSDTPPAGAPAPAGAKPDPRALPH